jgi:hypothetical protein
MSMQWAITTDKDLDIPGYGQFESLVMECMEESH